MTELSVHHRTPVQKCAGTGKPDDATLPDETQPVFHTSVNHSRKNYKLCTRLQSFYQLSRYNYRGVGSEY